MAVAAWRGGRRRRRPGVSPIVDEKAAIRHDGVPARLDITTDGNPMLT